jgi:hypothetical protein
MHAEHEEDTIARHPIPVRQCTVAAAVPYTGAAWPAPIRNCLRHIRAVHSTLPLAIRLPS